MCQPLDNPMTNNENWDISILRHLLGTIENASDAVEEARRGNFDPLPLSRDVEARNVTFATTNKTDGKASTTASPKLSASHRSSKSSKHSVRKAHERIYVHHNYHDYSTEPIEKIEALNRRQQEHKNKGGIKIPFPVVLFDVLRDAEKNGFEHILSWQEHGRAFKVHNQGLFVTEVMPKFFRQSQFSSFQRQLSLYGFLRLTRKGSDHGCYYHEKFLRGMKPLCFQIKRERVKGYGVRQSSSPELEPDFYRMTYVNAPLGSSTNGVEANVKALPPQLEDTKPCADPSAMLRAVLRPMGDVSASEATSEQASLKSLMEFNNTGRNDQSAQNLQSQCIFNQEEYSHTPFALGLGGPNSSTMYDMDIQPTPLPETRRQITVNSNSNRNYDNAIASCDLEHFAYTSGGDGFGYGPSIQASIDDPLFGQYQQQSQSYDDDTDDSSMSAFSMQECQEIASFLSDVDLGSENGHQGKDNEDSNYLNDERRMENIQKSLKRSGQ